MALTPALLVHTMAGGVGLLAGVAALAFYKGGRLHRIAGVTFSVSMLVVGATGVYLGVVGPLGIGASLVGALACYLVLTGWLTVRRTRRGVGAAELGCFFLGCGIAAAMLAFALNPFGSAASEVGGSSAGRAFVMAGIATWATSLDLVVILRRGIAGAGRISRHVWRMGMMFFLATVFFFPGQPDIFVGVPLGVLFAPPLAVLAAMAFWLWRVRFAERFQETAVSASGEVPEGVLSFVAERDEMRSEPVGREARE